MSTRSRQAEEARRRRRRSIALGVGSAVVLVVVVVLVALTLSSDGDDGGDPPAAALDVSMVEMAFLPDPIEVASDDAVLRIVNDGEVEHSMLVPDLGKGTPDLQPGQELTIDLTDQEPGEYYVFCDVPGHREAGMETTLVITDE